jgi:peptidoglycan hydrolase-like protein with peptidoglycan-binding domain
MDAIKRGSAPQREASLLQVFLREAGYDVNPDGDFGPGTEKAVRQF